MLQQEILKDLYWQENRSIAHENSSTKNLFKTMRKYLRERMLTNTIKTYKICGCASIYQNIKGCLTYEKKSKESKDVLYYHSFPVLLKIHFIYMQLIWEKAICLKNAIIILFYEYINNSLRLHQT